MSALLSQKINCKSYSAIFTSHLLKGRIIISWNVISVLYHYVSRNFLPRSINIYTDPGSYRVSWVSLIWVELTTHWLLGVEYLILRFDPIEDLRSVSWGTCRDDLCPEGLCRLDNWPFTWPGIWSKDRWVLRWGGWSRGMLRVVMWKWGPVTDYCEGKYPLAAE